MSGLGAHLGAHLATGVTTTCQCWAITRRDGVVMGFTDHDRDLAFEGVVFRAESGLTGRALQQVSGLAVDNSEAVGAFSDAGLREEDLRAGRLDGAEIRMWLVNWADVEARLLRFCGSLGEVVQEGGAFRAELRGLSEALNRPLGRVIRAGCDAVFGDRRCGLDLRQAVFGGPYAIIAIRDGRTLLVEPLAGTAVHVPGWFLRGSCHFAGGAADGIRALVVMDRAENGLRRIDLAEEPGVAPVSGDVVRLVAGCDGRLETCAQAYGNILNFRGFPHVPSEDWITAWPRRELAAGA